jgi:multiple sugar transport system substrate-binding protein
MKRFFAWVIVSVLIVSLTACSNKNTNNSTNTKNTKEAKITIQFWNGHTGPDGEVMNKLVKEFESTHPNIQIDVQSMAWDQLFTKIDLALSKGSGPDLITLPADRIIENADKILKPINDLVKTNFNKSDFDSSLWNLTIYNGKQYGIPLDTHPYVLYYRKDIFDKNKIKISNDKPMTKEEFLKIGEKLTNKSSGIYGFVFKDLGVHAVWDTWSIFVQTGGQIWGKDGENPQLNSNDMINTISFLRSLQGKISPDQLVDWQTAYTMFVNGKAAMLMHGSWLIPALKKVNIPWGVTMVPQIFNSEKAFANMHLFGFTRLDKKRTDAALEFVKWVETKDKALEWGLGSGNVPALLSAREEYAKNSLLSPIAKTAELNKDNLFMSPYIKNDTTIIYKYIQPTLESIYKDKTINIKDAMTKLNDEVKNAIIK